MAQEQRQAALEELIQELRDRVAHLEGQVAQLRGADAVPPGSEGHPSFLMWFDAWRESAAADPDEPAWEVADIPRTRLLDE